jgi:Endonuclease NucS
MYRADRFAAYFLGLGNKPSSLNNYQVVLKKADLAIGGLDEKLMSEGDDAVLRWAKTTNAEALKPYLKDLPSITKKYAEFNRVSGPVEPRLDQAETQILEDFAEPSGSAFPIEREMHSAVRNQLAALEPGLREADGGVEITVSTGRIDILAEDREGRLVVIELKVGTCPPGALEQAQGYAASIEAKEGRSVRAIVIAQSFPERVRSAARRMRDLELRSYEFLLRFQAVD